MTDIESTKTEIQRLEKRAKQLVDTTTSINTKKAYSNAWKQFETWAEKMNFSCLPASAEIVAAYLTHLDDIGRRPATMSLYLTAINQAHVLSGLDSPIDARVRKILTGSKRRQGTAQRQVAPITVEHLKHMLKCCDRDFLGVRNKAILLVGWSAALRRSSIAALDVEDLEERPDGLVLTLRRSKADQLGEGFKVGLPFVERDDCCPVRALRRWLDLAGIKKGPVFRKIGKGGRNTIFSKTYNRISEKMISIIIKQMAHDAGYNSDTFSGHSLRAGLATSAAQAGLAERDIMNITGHRSEKTLRGYIRDGSIFRKHPAKELLK